MKTEAAMVKVGSSIANLKPPNDVSTSVWLDKSIYFVNNIFLVVLDTRLTAHTSALEMAQLSNVLITDNLFW